MGEQEVPAPRFKEYGDFGQYKVLITDEQEWLARPAAWGIQVLAKPARKRKQDLYDALCWSFLAGKAIRCEFCRSIVVNLFGENKHSVLESIPQTESLRKWYGSRHPTGECEAYQILRHPGEYNRGIITEVELFNKLVDAIFGILHHPDRINTDRLVIMQEWKERERGLALELVGPNPFRFLRFDPSWRSDTVLSLARMMDDSRDFSSMPILADALQDAGCDNEDILNHCRFSEAHTRGCWVLDRILEYEWFRLKDLPKSSTTVRPEPLPSPQPHLLTTTEFNQMGEQGWFESSRAFLMDGVVMEQGPMDPPHANALELLTEVIRAAFGTGWRIRVRSPLHVDTYNDPMPDLAVVAGKPGNHLHPTSAALVVDVPDSAADTEKADRYARAGVADYWVLDLNARRLLVFRDPQPSLSGMNGSFYHERIILFPTDRVSPLATPQASILVGDLLP
jgi:Uma2 family endonuclease